LRTFVLPAGSLSHRLLVRYRIEATVELGARISVPYHDESVSNGPKEQRERVALGTNSSRFRDDGQ
jgi:hypothetical protein